MLFYDFCLEGDLKMKKPLFTCLLALVMVLGMLSATAMAAAGTGSSSNYPYLVGNDTELIDAIQYLAEESNGGYIKLTGDIESHDADNTIKINSGNVFTLDLDGNSLAGVSDQTGSNRNMFDVRGTLTVSNGTITLEHTGNNMGWGSSTNVFHVEGGGNLTITSATIENLGGSDMAFAVHLNNWGEVTLNVQENSTLTSTYIPVRVFNSGPHMNNVTIEDSTLESTDGNRALWVHNFTDADNGGKGTLESTLNFDIFNNNNTFTVANSDANRLIEYGYTNPINFDEDGNYVVRNEYALRYALSKGGKITLATDLSLSSVLTIDKNTVLDGNGKTLTSTAGRAINVETAGTVSIENLTINAAERAINIINQPATVTIDNVTATANNNAVMIATSAGAANVTITDSNFTGLAVVNVAGAGAQVEINDTTITNVDASGEETYGAITVWSSAATAKVTVTGGEIIVAGDSRKAYVFPADATVTGVDEICYIIATIGDAGFDTLADAIESVKLVKKEVEAAGGAVKK